LRSDVILIGAGVIGLTTAHELLRHGASVTLLERNCCALESSWAGAGILSPLLPWDYPDPVTQLTQMSNQLYPRFIDRLREETGVDPEYRASGMLVLPGQSADQGMANDSRARLAASWCARNAFPLKRVPNATKIVPALAFDPAAFWLPEVCQVRNPRLLRALRRSVEMNGGVIVEHSEVTCFKIERGSVQSVRIRDGREFSAASYAVTAGAWSQELLGEYALNLDIWPVRGEILLFKARPGMFDAIVLQEPDNFYLIPRQDGHILAGSTVEFAGFDKRTTRGARNILLKKARHLVPELTDELVVQQWAGLRPGSSRNIPVIDAHPSVSNLFLSSGHYRYGVTMAPGSGQLLSNMILNKPQSIDMTPYRWPV
jgi:glycine oxidase